MIDELWTDEIWLSRLKKLQTSFSISADQAVLLSRNTDLTYFCGVPFLVPEEREALLVVTGDQYHLLQTSFSPFKPASFIEDHRGCYPQDLARVIEQLKIKEILIDEESLFVAENRALEKNEQLEVKPLERSLIWQQRMVKDGVEIKLMKKAGQTAARVWRQVEAEFKVGVTELEMRDVIERKLREQGSSQPAFPTIVAFGANGALPHHQPTAAKLKKNQVVLVDFGATVDGYRSDMTRSFWFGGEHSSDFLEVEKVVKDAYQAVVDQIEQADDQSDNETKNPAASNTKADTKTVTARNLDTTAREMIRAAGYGPQFIHTTGHGVGLDIHESPSLNWRNDQQILPGMTITIEPGIYQEGKFGYRHENTVLIGEKRVISLTG